MQIYTFGFGGGAFFSPTLHVSRTTDELHKNDDRGSHGLAESSPETPSCEVGLIVNNTNTL